MGSPQPLLDDPKRKEFAPGDAYSWPRAAVLGPAGIDVGQLCVLATNPTETLYYPARLTTGDPHAAVTGYRFRFQSRGGVELDYKIAREVEGRLIPVVESERNEDFGGSLDFTWDGRGHPSGVYHLQLEGTVFLTRDREVRIDVPFVHHDEAP